MRKLITGILTVIGYIAVVGYIILIVQGVFGYGSLSFADYLLSGIGVILFIVFIRAVDAALGWLEQKFTRVHAMVGGNIADSAEFVSARTPQISMQDVIASEEPRKKITDALQKITDFSKGKGEPANGILLSGPPGSGKTMMAEAIAGETGAQLIVFTFQQVASRWINQTNEQISQVFVEARSVGASHPVVLFIDEVDSLLLDRSITAGYGESQTLQNTNTLLTEIQDLHNRWQGVIVVAATNHPDNLDKAGTRRGRFDFHVDIGYPDHPGRIELMKRAIPKGFSFDTPATVERVARRWPNRSPKVIMDAVKEAAETVKKQGRNVIGPKDLMAAMRAQQSGSGDMMSENALSLSDMVFGPTVVDSMHNLLDRMKNLDEVEQFGGKIPNGVLFSGDPGTGKTAAAMALAKDAEWGYVETTGAKLVSGKARLADVVAKAIQLAPCVVFIDEADDALALRNDPDNPQGGQATKPIVNDVLTVMNATPPEVLFIAATNNPDMIDPAALRGGRFGEKINFTMPGPAEIAKLVQIKMSSLKGAKFSEEVTEAKIIKLLEGQSPANIGQILSTAVSMVAASYAAKRRATPEILLDDLGEAILSVTGVAPTQIGKEDPSRFQNAMNKLNAMIGLDKMKESIRGAVSTVKANRARIEQGLPVKDTSMHMVFTGNPGTGKTTVARLVGDMYAGMGLLRKGHVVEVSRADLVAGYLGQTEQKTRKVFNSALDGVLFVDEAYMLNDGDDGKAFGKQALDLLMKLMEDNRDRIAVILAGYPAEMEQTLQMNPGVKARFNKIIHFEDYSAEDLEKIFLHMADEHRLSLEPEAIVALRSRIEQIVANKAAHFANAREMRNLLENAIEKQAVRYAMTGAPLNILTKEDLS